MGRKHEVAQHHRDLAKFHRQASEQDNLVNNERLKRQHTQMAEYYERLADEIEYNLGDVN